MYEESTNFLAENSDKIHKVMLTMLSMMPSTYQRKEYARYVFKLSLAAAAVIKSRGTSLGEDDQAAIAIKLFNDAKEIMDNLVDSIEKDSEHERN